MKQINELQNKIKEKIKQNGDFYLFYMGTKGKWITWITAKQWLNFIQKKENQTIPPPNQRQIFKNEIILDLDLPTKKQNTILKEKITQKLIKHKTPFKLYDTGGKGYHYHIEIKNLEKLKPQLRTEYKKEFLKHYFQEELKQQAIDLSNCVVKKLIQLENTPHRKTNKTKTLIKEYKTKQHKINKIILNKALKTIKRLNQIQQITKNKYDKNIDCRILEASLRYKFPEGKRNNILTKNLAIYIHDNPKLQYTAEQYIKIQKMSSKELIGWLKQAKERKITKINYIELQKYVKELNKKGFFLPFQYSCSQCRKCELIRG